MRDCYEGEKEANIRFQGHPKGIHLFFFAFAFGPNIKGKTLQ
jgi:hypothetical protein